MLGLKNNEIKMRMGNKNGPVSARMGHKNSKKNNMLQDIFHDALTDNNNNNSNKYMNPLEKR